MEENLKIQLLIEVIKKSLEGIDNKESTVYKTLNSVLELAEGIKNEKL
jgi:hypothetical protein